MLGLATVLPSSFLPSLNRNLHAGRARSMRSCNSCISLRFASGWPAMYLMISACGSIRLSVRLALVQRGIRLAFHVGKELLEICELTFGSFLETARGHAF